MGQQTEPEAPKFQLLWRSSTVDLLEVIHGIFSDLLQLLNVFEVCALPAPKVFDELLQDSWH